MNEILDLLLTELREMKAALSKLYQAAIDKMDWKVFDSLKADMSAVDDLIKEAQGIDPSVKRDDFVPDVTLKRSVAKADRGTSVVVDAMSEGRLKVKYVNDDPEPARDAGDSDDDPRKERERVPAAPDPHSVRNFSAPSDTLWGGKYDGPGGTISIPVLDMPKLRATNRAELRFITARERSAFEQRPTLNKAKEWVAYALKAVGIWGSYLGTTKGAATPPRFRVTAIVSPRDEAGDALLRLVADVGANMGIDVQYDFNVKPTEVYVADSSSGRAETFRVGSAAGNSPQKKAPAASATPVTSTSKQRISVPSAPRPLDEVKEAAALMGVPFVPLDPEASQVAIHEIARGAIGKLIYIQAPADLDSVNRQAFLNGLGRAARSSEPGISIIAYGRAMADDRHLLDAIKAIDDAVTGKDAPTPPVYILGGQDASPYLSFGAQLLPTPPDLEGAGIALISVPPEHAEYMIKRLASGWQSRSQSHFTTVGEAVEYARRTHPTVATTAPSKPTPEIAKGANVAVAEQPTEPAPSAGTSLSLRYSTALGFSISGDTKEHKEVIKGWSPVGKQGWKWRWSTASQSWSNAEAGKYDFDRTSLQNLADDLARLTRATVTLVDDDGPASPQVPPRPAPRASAPEKAPLDDRIKLAKEMHKALAKYVKSHAGANQVRLAHKGTGSKAAEIHLAVSWPFMQGVGLKSVDVVIKGKSIKLGESYSGGGPKVIHNDDPLEAVAAAVAALDVWSKGNDAGPRWDERFDTSLLVLRGSMGLVERDIRAKLAEEREAKKDEPKEAYKATVAEELRYSADAIVTPEMLGVFERISFGEAKKGDFFERAKALAAHIEKHGCPRIEPAKIPSVTRSAMNSGWKKTIRVARDGVDLPFREVEFLTDGHSLIRPGVQGAKVPSFLTTSIDKSRKSLDAASLIGLVDEWSRGRRYPVKLARSAYILVTNTIGKGKILAPAVAYDLRPMRDGLVVLDARKVGFIEAIFGGVKWEAAEATSGMVLVASKGKEVVAFVMGFNGGEPGMTTGLWTQEGVATTYDMCPHVDEVPLVSAPAASVNPSVGTREPAPRLSPPRVDDGPDLVPNLPERVPTWEATVEQAKGFLASGADQLRRDDPHDLADAREGIAYLPASGGPLVELRRVTHAREAMALSPGRGMLRAPHHSIAAIGMAREVMLGHGGVIFLDGAQGFISAAAVATIAALVGSISRRTIIAWSSPDDQADSIQRKLAPIREAIAALPQSGNLAKGANVVVSDEGSEGVPAASKAERPTSRAALDALYRAQLDELHEAIWGVPPRKGSKIKGLRLKIAKELGLSRRPAPEHCRFVKRASVGLTLAQHKALEANPEAKSVIIRAALAESLDGFELQGADCPTPRQRR